MSVGGPTRRTGPFQDDGSVTATYHGARRATASARRARGDSLGRYVVLEEVGAGGMGVVYAAYDPELDRRVALKVLGAGRASGEEGRRRLLREAQALARLTHPHVVAVHDVGSFDAEVFLAMEFVEGEDLAAWLEAESRPWREILPVFLQAAEGLSAAHDAGLAHRDFKPANVRIGVDGRVRVLDFGLALTLDGVEGEGDSDTPLGSPAALETLTRAGVVFGTPRYMAPEQHLGRGADARSDQFAFCVSLWEALYGEHPFPAADRDDFLARAKQGPPPEPPEPPVDLGAPAALHRILVRGLAYDPESRFGSLGELSQALRDEVLQPPGRLGARAIAFGLVAVLGALGAARWWGGEAPCRGAEGRLAGIWDGVRRAAVERALGSEGPAWRSAAPILDTYARDWREMYTEACEATHVRGEQSTELLDLRMACLDDRRLELGALVDLLEAPSPSLGSRAAAAAAALSRLAPCANSRALLSPVRPPSADPARRAEIDGVRRQLAEVRALRAAGEYASGIERAEAAAASADALGYTVLRAEALLELGDLRERNGAYPAARRAFLEAALAAEEGRADDVRARALVGLMWIVGHRQGQAQEARPWMELAGSVVRRLDDEPELAMRWYQAAALVHLGLGDHDAAAREAAAAVDRAEVIHGPGGLATADILATQGTVEGHRGEFAAALESYLRVAEIRLRALGPGHARVGLADHAVATLLLQLGRYGEALPRLERCLTIAQGTRDDHLAQVHADLGAVKVRLGRADEALGHLSRARDLWRGLHGPRSPKAAAAANYFGDAYLEMGDPDAARPHLEEALTLTEDLLGPGHPAAAPALINLTQAALRQGRLEEARGFLRRASGLLSENHPWTALVDRADGQLSLEEGDVAAAALALGRAVGTLERDRRSNPFDLAGARLDLARALWAGEERSRARELAEGARDFYRSVGRAGEPGAAKVAAWFGDRGLDPASSGSGPGNDLADRRASEAGPKSPPR